jgi:hypothetical protein
MYLFSLEEGRMATKSTKNTEIKSDEDILALFKKIIL